MTELICLLFGIVIGLLLTAFSAAITEQGSLLVGFRNFLATFVVAGALGMRQSHFVNPNGLHDDAHVSSAQDMAILARALLRSLDVVHDAEQVLDVVADLVGDDVGLGEIPGRPESILQVVVETEVDVDLAIARTIKRADGGGGKPASRLDLTGKQHEGRFLVGLAQTLELFVPDVLGIGEYD